jgi:hypothetical protein
MIITDATSTGTVTANGGALGTKGLKGVAGADGTDGVAGSNGHVVIFNRLTGTLTST